MAAAAAATVSAALEEEMGVYYIQEKNRNSLSKEKNYNNRSISFLGATNFPVTSSSTVPPFIMLTFYSQLMSLGRSNGTTIVWLKRLDSMPTCILVLYIGVANYCIVSFLHQWLLNKMQVFI